MSTSGLVVSSSCPDEAARKRTLTANQKRKERRLRKKMSYLQQQGLLQDEHKNNNNNNRTGQLGQGGGPPRHNGAFTKHTSPHVSTHKNDDDKPQPGSTAGAPQCSSNPSTSARSLPSWTESSIQIPITVHKSTGVPSKYLAIDCEMVGTGPKGSISQLARCSVVSYDGDVVYDKFIKPSVPVTDYRTRWSGIRHRDLVRATPFTEARKEILKLLMGKVVIGHAIHNDFKVLSYSHPAALTRDTSRIPLLNRKAGIAEHECASLKRLTKAIFNRDIQTGKKGHSSVEDARATMELYKVVELEWERQLASKARSS